MTAALTAPTTDTVDLPDLSEVLATGSDFTDALCEVEALLDVDPDEARERFRAALALATTAEREFLDRVVDLLSRQPWPVAARQLGWMAKSRSEWRDMIMGLTTETDPGLHIPSMPAIREVSIEAADWVARSLRERSDRHRDRLTATPSRETDAARLRPEAIAARRARTLHPPTEQVNLRHRDRDRRTAARRDAEFAAYAATRLFAIDTEPEPRDTNPVAEPRKPAHLLWSHVQAALWDRSYFLHIAETYTDRDRYLLDPEATSTDRVRSGRHRALDADASRFLREHSVETGPVDKPTEAWRHRKPGRRARISPIDQSRFAARRTGLATPSNYDIFLPYSDLDTPESTWEGSGLDYDLAARVPYLGWPCVGCWIDRPQADRRAVHFRDGRLVIDDGLCDVCRADGHPGIPELSRPWDMQQFVESRCAYIAAAHPGQVRAILDRIRAAAANSGMTWRLITRWMATHLDQPVRTRASRPAAPRRRRRPGALGAGQRIGCCDACARTGVVHADNYCTRCRIDLGLITPRDRAA